MTALWQEQDTLGQQRCPQSNLRPFPPPQTFPSRGMFSQVGANGKGEERVSGGDWDWPKPLGEEERQRREEAMALVKRDPVEWMCRGLLLSQGTQAPGEYWGLDQDSSGLCHPLGLGPYSRNPRLCLPLGDAGRPSGDGRWENALKGATRGHAQGHRSARRGVSGTCGRRPVLEQVGLRHALKDGGRALGRVYSLCSGLEAGI